MRDGYLSLKNKPIDDIIHVEVSKLELNRMEWVRVKNAKDQAFFISDNYVFSFPANEPEIERDHIYLFRNKRLYSVNIRDNSFSVFLPLQNLFE